MLHSDKKELYLWTTEHKRYAADFEARSWGEG